METRQAIASYDNKKNLINLFEKQNVTIQVVTVIKEFKHTFLVFYWAMVHLMSYAFVCVHISSDNVPIIY